MTVEKCPCGRSVLHYSSKAAQAVVEALVEKLGPEIKVTVQGRSYMVPRHYIALHGLRASEVGNRFKEIPRNE